MPGTLSKQKLELINQSFLFANVDEIVVRRIIYDSRCFRKKYNKGAIVSETETSDGALGIILSGQLLVRRITGENEGTKIQTLQVGECIGAASVFSRKDNRMLRITAERQTEVFFIPGKTLRWAIERSSMIMENYIRFLSDTIWTIQSRIFILSAGTAELRLAVFLADRCDSEGVVSGSMSEISRQLNLGRASLYRAINKLESDDLIRQNGKTILVMSRERLHAFIDGSFQKKNG